MSSDPIADFLNGIHNALRAQHRHVEFNWSKFKQNIAEVLKQQGFIESYAVKHEKPYSTIRVVLKYYDGRKPVIQGIKRMSKPGLRKYVGADEIPQFYGRLGVPILSTPEGVFSGLEARKRKIGGELLCLVW